jgi:hypothetical protein
LLAVSAVFIDFSNVCSYSFGTGHCHAQVFKKGDVNMESKYSKEQQHFLHKIQHLKQYKSLPEESDIVTFMHREKMIDIFFDPSTQQSYCKITEAGKAYLHTLKVSNRWRRIPIIISVIALIISALSIVLSPFFQIYFTKLYGL